MAIKIGKQSEEGAFKLYKGIAAFNIVAVNPSKAELEKLTGRTYDDEPKYLDKDDEGNTTMRITFYGKTDTSKEVNNGIELLLPISFVLTNIKRTSQSGKIQVIDKYGRTVWVTQSELDAHSIPQYSNGPANISVDYRPAVRGEEQLINFLIKWLNIPGPANYKDGKWIMKDNPEDSEVSLNLTKIFAGDVNELRDIISMVTAYCVKAAVGIRTTDDGKQFQSVFTREFAKNAVTDYSKLDAAITEFQNNGGAPNTVFDVNPLHENIVESTQFVRKEEDDLPPDNSPWANFQNQ